MVETPNQLQKMCIKADDLPNFDENTHTHTNLKPPKCKKIWTICGNGRLSCLLNSRTCPWLLMNRWLYRRQGNVRTSRQLNIPAGIAKHTFSAVLLGDSTETLNAVFPCIALVKAPLLNGSVPTLTMCCSAFKPSLSAWNLASPTKFYPNQSPSRFWSVLLLPQL